jgi:hypothetical protein
VPMTTVLSAPPLAQLGLGEVEAGLRGAGAACDRAAAVDAAEKARRTLVTPSGPSACRGREHASVQRLGHVYDVQGVCALRR